MNRYVFIRAVAAAAVLCLCAGNAFGQAMSELFTWYSPSRGDHFTTTDPRWADRTGARRSPDYTLIRVEGRLFSPDAPQPPGTVAVYSYWNADRGDNFLTSDPRWNGVPAQEGYTRTRLEGYAFERPISGSTPLLNFWSAPREDNYASTDPRFILDRGAIIPNHHTYDTRGAAYRQFRTIGYVMPPMADAADSSSFEARLSQIGFGDWSPLRPQDHGRRPEDPLDRARPASTPLLVTMVAFADMEFGRDDLVRYGRLFGATGRDTLSTNLRSASSGQYDLPATIAPVVRDTITFEQAMALGPQPEHALGRFDEGLSGRETFEREYGWNLDVYDMDGDGVERHELHYRTRVLYLINRVVNFSRYDANRDGRVDTSELLIMRFGADPGIGGQAGRPMADTLDGVAVDTTVLLVAKDTTLAGLTHEIMHTWGGVDIYGPGYALNLRSTVMAGMTFDDRFYQFDPWHRQRFGWVMPRFIPITEAGGTALLTAPGHASPGEERARPILLYDPDRGFDEYFYIEFRTRFPLCPGSGLMDDACSGYSDAGAASTGMVVWHYREAPGDDIRPADIFLRDDRQNRVNWYGATEGGAHMLHMAVISAPDELLGGRRYWRDTDGDMNLRWWDGSPVGVTLSVGPVNTNTRVLAVSWRPTGGVHIPRIDFLGVAGAEFGEFTEVAAGRTFHLDGAFGAARGDLVAALFDAGGNGRLLQIRSFSPSRLTVTVPTSMPNGIYELAIGARASFNSRRREAMSNGALIRVGPIEVATQLNVPIETLSRLPNFSGVRLTQTTETGQNRFEAPPAAIEGIRVIEGAPPREPQPSRPINPHGYMFGDNPALHRVENPSLEERLEDEIRDRLREVIIPLQRRQD